MRRAPLALRALALFIDLGWVSAACASAIRLLGAPPYPSIETVLKLALLTIPLWVAQITLIKGTIGQRALRLMYLDKRGEPYSGTETLVPVITFSARLWQTGPLRSTGLATAVLLMIATLLTNATLGLLVFRSQPALQKAVLWQVPAFTPAADPYFRRQWITLPFYYAVGTWPKKFRGKPVFFVLPYQKGPPQQFPGKIYARWEMPQTQLTIEGPKTPPDLPELATIKACVLGETTDQGLLGCLRIRKQVLSRHVHEMERTKPKEWKIRWFEVNNPALPENERPRGVYLLASNGKSVQERFVLINNQGAHQTLLLNRPASKDGEEARSELELIIGSLRMTDKLDTGRAWINNELAQTRLDDLKHLRDSLSFVARLSEIQAMLISQISVEPGNINAYYHLGGLSLMLIKHAAELRTQRTQIVPTHMLLMLDEWTAAVEPMVKAALEYVRDIDPTHPHLSRLENLWVEAQKL